MFKCVECETGNNKRGKLKKGNSGYGVKEFRVATVIRKVRYLNQIKVDKAVPNGEGYKVAVSYKTLNEKTGTEIVKEESYCNNHIPENPQVKILPEVKRMNIIKVKNHYREKTDGN